ncbi:Putative protein phosphatase 2C 76 [Apostasia shenzhenica]|uniref:protein-serine/threonine phosphatase n=1 Tax=Apostasia shenzhenica TaxID=1088818 RepID=A0A2H9ZZS4_9ASPA|nr:Putative protein phosphatase 2C 76 [Apostasia shenzhenica]
MPGRRFPGEAEVSGRSRHLCLRYTDPILRCDLFPISAGSFGRRGVMDIRVGIVAVFDGHNGADASDLASKLLLEYFFLHVYFLLDSIYSVALKKSAEKLTYGAEHNAILQVLKSDKHESWQKLGQDRFEWMSSTIFDEAFHLEILKESLVRTIHDIDVTFSKEALKLNIESGSTATVVLIANGHILTANVGDSKAFLCSKGFDSLLGKGSKSKLNRGRRRKDLMTTINTYGDFKMTNYGGSGYYVKELTKDHHLARDDERDRVEASGGYVVEWAGVLRVNGELALSRAIGDVPFKRYGVIPVPEVTDWQYLTKNDSFLVAASDGIFEKMTTQEVCDVLWDEKSTFSSPLWCVHDLSCADCIVNNAFDRGSMDNLAAVVVPLESGCIFQHLMQGHHEGDEIGTSLISSHYYKKMISKFDRLLIEANNKRLGCFYLSENLNDDMDYVFQVPKHVSDNDFGNFDPTLQEPHPSVGPLDIYSDQSFCWHIGFYEGDNGQCTSPNVFTEFLGLIDSAPFNDTKSNYTKSYSHKVPDLRYRLKRRFDRGSYGEVWLAFHWNCSEEHDASNPVHRIQACSASIPQLNTGEYDENPCMGPSEACQRNLSTVPSFILKRIMVRVYDYDQGCKQISAALLLNFLFIYSF